MGALRKDVRPIDANVEELGYCARTCVSVLTTVNGRTSMTTTNISMMRTKVKESLLRLPKSISFNEELQRKPETNIQKRFEDVKSEFPPESFQPGK